MKTLFIIFTVFFSMSLQAQSLQNGEIAKKFYEKHKISYLYCQNLTDSNQNRDKTCYPLKSLTLRFEDQPNKYLSQANYHDGKLVLSFSKKITTDELLQELLKYSERLLEPLS